MKKKLIVFTRLYVFKMEHMSGILYGILVNGKFVLRYVGVGVLYHEGIGFSFSMYDEIGNVCEDPEWTRIYPTECDEGIRVFSLQRNFGICLVMVSG